MGSINMIVIIYNSQINSMDISEVSSIYLLTVGDTQEKNYYTSTFV